MELNISALLNIFPLLAPEAVLVTAACLIFLGGTWRSDRHLWSIIALAALAVALLLCPYYTELRQSLRLPASTVYVAPALFDSLTDFVRYIAFGGGIILVLLNWNELPDRQAADHHACLLLIIAGVSMTAAANDLIALFLALELVSIPTYVLLYLPRHDEASQEAAMKYFMLSVFSSALLLFGFSYLYGLAGTTNIAALLHTLNGVDNARDLPMVAHLALIMIVAGIGFRITAVPFHFYAPDVYQGTSTGGAALLAFVPKVAGFVALLRVLGFILPTGMAPRNDLFGLSLSDQVPILFWFLAVVTMFVGNVLALWQDNLKRLLAYSSVAHAGYMLMALSMAPYLRSTTAGPDAAASLLYYLVAYGAMTIGAFGVIAYLDTRERPVATIDDIAGLSRSHPGIALLMVVFLFSLIGVPLTAGFTGKLLIFFGAMAVPDPQYAWLFRVLAVIGVINAAIGAWYYLRIIAAMYLRSSLHPILARRSWAGLGTLWICALLTVGLSLPPGVNWLLTAAREATVVGK